MCFHWKSLLRQIRVVGTLQQVDNKVADEYYNSRAYESRIGAWASQQSNILKDRAELLNKLEDFKKKYKDFVTRDGFIKKHYSRTLKRIQSISLEHNIDDLYIFQTSDDVPDKINGKIVMNDFSLFWSAHKRGICGHPIDPAYNRKMCEFIIPYLS